MMKFLFLLVFCFACASNRNVAVNPNPTPGYQEAISMWGLPKTCKPYAMYRYCQWSDDELLVFKGDEYVTHLKKPEEKLNFTVDLDLESKKKVKERKVFLQQKKGAKANVAANWERLYPYLKTMFTFNKFEVVDSKDKADLIANIDYGLVDKKSSESNRRHYLTVVTSKKGDVLWKLHAESDGKLSEVKNVIPALAACTDDMDLGSGKSMKTSRDIHSQSSEMMMHEHFARAPAVK